jgi:hypothetical protein
MRSLLLVLFALIAGASAGAGIAVALFGGTEGGEVTPSSMPPVAESGQSVKKSPPTSDSGEQFQRLANALLTISGAPLVALSDLTALYVGLPGLVTQLNLKVDTAYGDAAQDIFSAVTYERVRWHKSAAYLVAFGATHGVADTGAEQPKLNVKVGGSLVSTNDSNKGLQLSATPGTWTENSAVEIDTANYSVERGDAIELRCTVSGTNGDADILSVNCIFVSE